MKRIAFCLLFVLSFCINTTVFAKFTKSNLPPTQQTEAQFLYVINAKTGTLSKDKKGHYQLVLHDVDRNVTYFSDRSQRVSGMLDAPHFVNVWNKNTSLIHNPPNANIQAIKLRATKGNQQLDVSVELYKPQYFAKTHTMRFDLKPLAGSKIPEGALTFQDAAIFIDNFVCLSCIG